MASEFWQWVGIATIDGLIVAALAYALYEQRVRRGAHHEDAPPQEPATPPRSAAPVVPRQAGAHHAPPARTCAWVEQRHPGWRVEYDPWRGEYRAQRDIDATDPATAAAEDPWELDQAISQYSELAASLRELATPDREAA